MVSKRIERPIFIFGCSNSGTTILWQALKGHKDVCGPEVEGQDLADLPRVMTHWLGRETFRLWAHPKFKLAYLVTEDDLTPEITRQIRRAYRQYLKPGKRFVAKSPADTFRARLIQAVFPDAYFIAIVRNGYAVAEGIKRKRWRDPERPHLDGQKTSIQDAAVQWFRANVEVILLKDHLRRYRIVRYEDLVADPARTLRSLLRCCGLTARGFLIPQFDTHRNQKQIARLSKKEAETIWSIAGQMLTHHGYGYGRPKPAPS